jgi:hypothetical protein
MTPELPDPSAWGGFTILNELHGGFRNRAYLVRAASGLSALKSTRGSEASVAWVDRVHDIAEQAGLRVPRLVPDSNARLASLGWTLEPFVQGKPASPAGLRELAPAIARFHRLAGNMPQRSGFASCVDLVTCDAGGDIDLNAMPERLVECAARHGARWQASRNVSFTVISIRPTF